MSKFFLLIAIGLGFLIVLLDGFITFYSNQEAASLFDERNALDQESALFQQLLNALVDSHASERGFVITGENRYLELYNKAMAFIKDPKTDAFLAEQAKREDAAKDLRKVVDGWIIGIEAVVELRRTQGFEAAEKRVAVGHGEMLITQARSIVGAMLEERQQQIRLKQSALKEQWGKISLITSIGSVVVFLLMGSCLTAIYLYATDLENRKKHLDSLIKEKDTITSLSRAVILTLDSNGIITTCNKAAEETSGYSKSEIIGKPFSQFINLEDDKINMKNLSKKYSREFKGFSDVLLVAKRVPVEEDVIWTAKNREPLFLQASIAPLPNSDGVFNGYLIEANEVTERVRQDEKLLDARLQAENANLAKSRFLASMSHDFRTPLTAIMGYTEILQANNENNLSEKQFAFLKRIEENSQHLLEMIRDIMDLEKFEARKETIQLSDVLVDVLIEQVFKEVELEAEKKGIVLKLEGAEQLAPLRTDEQKLYRILLNLISNGVKFTDVGSVRVVVTKNRETHLPEQIDVIDTGIGIDQAHQKQIFQPFFQVDRAAKRGERGTGLGLSICMAYCRLLGYNLSFQSELGKGSTFTIRLT